MNQIANPQRLGPIVAEYEQKIESASNSIQDMQNAITTFESACRVRGIYGGSISPSFYMSESQIHKSLRISAWRHLHEILLIDRIAPASDKARFEREMQDPPEFTMENIRATFGPYIADPRQSILRGLAEAFCGLEPAYKSHSNVRIGVAKLPKRIIINNAYTSFGTNYGSDKLVDVINALRVFQSRGMIGFYDLKGKHATRTEPAEPGHFETGLDGLTFKTFKNGNVHVIFDKQTCLDINRALAEYYGEVLPDTEDDNAPRQQSTAVAKDLQYYPTPVSIADRAVSDMYGKNLVVLEPSCGCGRLLDAVKSVCPEAKLYGYEVHAGRAEEARAKGHTVVVANFLDVPPSPEFDYVLMNPPFYGRHYLKHIHHAIKFLKPSGRLISILPATAHYDHGELPEGNWKDLPVGAFAESGTNVPTGIFEYTKEDS